MDDTLLTAEETAYHAIRALILEQALPIGPFLSQRMLAKAVGTTVVPVREAVRRLVADGLVETVPRWGVRIPIDTEEKVRDRYFMRETLELAAVRRVRERGDAAMRAQLQALAGRCDEIANAPEGDPRHYAQAHYAFHAQFVQDTGSPLLSEALNRLNLRSLLSINASRILGQGIRFRGPYHQTLLAAIFGPDEATALEAVREHIRTGLENELRTVSDQAPKCEAYGLP
jgi:DNA-binding GntR family transcriptional regulator